VSVVLTVLDTVVLAVELTELDTVEDCVVVAEDEADVVAVEVPVDEALDDAEVEAEVVAVDDTVLVTVEDSVVVPVLVAVLVTVLVAVLVTVVSLHSVKAPLWTPSSASFSKSTIVAQSSASRPVFSSLDAVQAMVPDVKLLGNVIRSITSFSPSVTPSHAPLPTSSRSTPFTGKQLRSVPLTTPDEHTDSRLPRSGRC
jgi:hypothetical protein